MPRMGNPTGKHRPKRRHHGEGTVVRRKDRWRAKPWAAVVPYIDPSGRRRETWLSAASRAEAEELLRDELKRRKAAPVRTEHTVGSYVRDWLMTAELSGGTFDRYRQHYEQRIAPTLGSVPLDELTPPMVRKAMSEWGLSVATRGGTFVVLRAAMRQAAADGMRDGDPTAGLKQPKPRPTTPTVLDIEDARHLRSVVAGERFAPILTVSLGLALRRGETLGLRTPDVDLEAGTVTVRSSLRRIPVSTRVEGEGTWRLQEPKADSGRTLPLPSFVADALRERLEQRAEEQRTAKVWAPNDLVFARVNGNPIAFTSLDHWFKDALARAGLPDMRFHELRASTATILIAEGVDLFTVSMILGHSSMEMTRRYLRLLPRVTRAAADTMNERLG